MTRVDHQRRIDNLPRQYLFVHISSEWRLVDFTFEKCFNLLGRMSKSGCGPSNFNSGKCVTSRLTSLA